MPSELRPGLSGHPPAMPQTSSPVPSGTMPDRLTAILLMCAAVTLFSCLDASAKYLVSHSALSTGQVVWMRFVGQALLMAASLGRWTIPSLLKTNKLGLQIVRSFLMVACTACNFIAVQYLRPRSDCRYRISRAARGRGARGADPW